ncbi:MAG: hypothetical protein M0P12_01330 [Paludibacteraceae bacterium]|nr:hypothetical protein [Paludibacteraceae bacterium]MCK9615523.1 hypothetical protein [Candidatus Omnitrophota bacterium]
MKLISKFKDRYDIYARNPNFSDQSWNRIWRREKQKMNNPWAYPQNQNIGFLKTVLEVERIYTVTIFFCGKEIPVIVLENYVYPSKNDVGNYQRQFFYNFEDFAQTDLFTSRNLKEDRGIREYFDVQNRIWTRTGDNGKSLVRLSPKEINLFFKTPVVVFGGLPYTLSEEFDWIEKEPDCFGSVAYLNPCLNDFQFFSKHMDAFAAFKEIERFISNDLVVPDMKDVKISDVLKAETHGFNKYSFRKDKSLT